MNINHAIEVLKNYYENPIIKESMNGEPFLSYDVEANGEIIYGIDHFEDDEKKLIDFWNKKDLIDLTNKVEPDLYKKLLNYQLKIEHILALYTGIDYSSKKENIDDFISEHYYDRPYFSYSMNIEETKENVLIYISIHFELTDKEIKPLFYISFGGVNNNNYHYVDFNDEKRLLEIIKTYFEN